MKEPEAMQDDLEYQYVTGQGRATFPALFEEYRAAGAAAEALGGWLWDLRYGEHPRETFDFRPAAASAGKVGTLIYLHAGYWQSRDKSQFRFIAPGLNEAGFDVALANYPLCPEVSVSDIVNSVCKLPRAVRAVSPPAAKAQPLIMAGHSAGAHLAVEIALKPEAAGAIDGVLGISGVYDLTDLVGTTLNENLRLDAGTARMSSPLHRLRGEVPPGAFVVGEGETEAFRLQTQAMANGWRALGACRHAVSPQDDHFTVLKSFCAADGLLRSILTDLVA
ncbi:alpha/beta hydrolase [Ottowia sp. VDI28]|uniref:alpha/beta hydrolase n=1 Tax=Ottowia sp. VDI28 TaxID=3133968 RepID=UPI003C2F2D59